MKGSRIVAIGLVAAAAAWIASGYLLPHESGESRAAVRVGEAKAQKLFRVGVVESRVAPHSSRLVLSGRTEADKKVMVMARTGGIITELKIRRGSRVEKNDIIAILSDEAREAQVVQARALLTQRKTELEAKRRLIEMGNMPRLDLVNLEAQFKAAEAGVAAAEAERDRGVVRAPWSGLVTDLSVEVGQAAFSFMGRELAQIISLDPVLAVVEVSERRLGSIKLGDTAEIRLVTGDIATGHIRHVSKSASQTTRTYRVEIEIANPDYAIPDGITAEVAIKLASAPATRVPRSALTFSSAGDLGVRIVDAEGKVAFIPVSVAEDDQAFMWVRGIPDLARIIVQGQDFVREGQRVEAITTEELTAAAR
jgi:membrane fusion protein, multidrug efflux system